MNLRTPYTTQRAKTQPSRTRLHPRRLTVAELDDLLAEDDATLEANLPDPTAHYPAEVLDGLWELTQPPQEPL